MSALLASVGLAFRLRMSRRALSLFALFMALDLLVGTRTFRWLGDFRDLAICIPALAGVAVALQAPTPLLRYAPADASRRVTLGFGLGTALSVTLIHVAASAALIAILPLFYPRAHLTGWDLAEMPSFTLALTAAAFGARLLTRSAWGAVPLLAFLGLVGVVTVVSYFVRWALMFGAYAMRDVVGLTLVGAAASVAGVGLLAAASALRPLRSEPSARLVAGA